MDESILIDSSIWIQWLSPQASGELKRAMEALLATDRAVINEMIRLEVIGGARSAGEFEKVRGDFEAIRCIETKPRVWQKAEDLSFLLGRRGQRVAAADVLIAAGAICHGAPLWHADRDFERVRAAVRNFRTFWYPRHNPMVA